MNNPVLALQALETTLCATVANISRVLDPPADGPRTIFTLLLAIMESKERNMPYLDLLKEIEFRQLCPNIDKEDSARELLIPMLECLSSCQRETISRFYGLDDQSPESMKGISRSFHRGTSGVSRQDVYFHRHVAMLKLAYRTEVYWIAKFESLQLLSLNKLQLPPQIREKLSEAGIETVGSLISYTRSELHRIELNYYGVGQIETALDKLKIGAGLKQDSLEKAGFSARTLNSLRKRGIDTIEAVLSTPKEELLEIRHFGQKCLQEVERFINMQEKKLRVVVIAPEDGWAYVRSEKGVHLIKPPYNGDYPLMDDRDPETAANKHGFVADDKEFDDWDEVKAYLNQRCAEMLSQQEE